MAGLHLAVWMELMSIPAVLLIGGLVAVFSFVIGVLVGRKYELLSLPYDDEGVSRRYVSEPVTTEPHKCSICTADVAFRRHDGLWRCSEHKALP